MENDKLEIYRIIQIVDDVQGEIEDLLKNGDLKAPVVIGQLVRMLKRCR